MPVARMHPENTALLVIDIQERLLPTIVDRDRIVTNATILLRMARALELPALITEQYVKGLGRTDERITAAMIDPSWRIEKTRFSALVDMVDQRLRLWQRDQVLVCGLEAHVCVLQTVLDLQNSGRQAYVCTDAISAGQRDQIQPALERMQSAGAILTGVVSAMYELLGDARHPAFRDCLQLAKAVSM